MSIMRRGANGNSVNGIQVKVVSGVTSPNGGGITNIPHGLELSSIVSWISTVAAANQKFMQGNTVTAGFRFQVFPDPTNMIVRNSDFSSENMRSAPVEILIWYRN